ncbi:MAG: DUF4833 domain-containing protein [Polyangiaceae bacterium]
MKVGRSAVIAMAVTLFAQGWAQAALADATGSADIASVFFVAKSENRNQVHYGIHLDRRCAPVGDRPVFGYWRMFERGPTATEPLLPIELGAYGVAEQHVLSQGDGGGKVRVVLGALRDRPIVIETRAEGGGCVAAAVTTVSGAAVSLWSVYVRIRWPFGVDSLTLTGRAMDDARIVEEKIRP